VKEILIHTSGSLGDILVLFPIMAGIRKQNPDARITLLNKHDTFFSASPLELSRQAGYVDDIKITKRWSLRLMKLFSFLPGLGRKKYDQVYWLIRDSRTLSNKIRREKAFFQRLSKSSVLGMTSLLKFDDKNQYFPRVGELLLERINTNNPNPIKPGTHLFPLTKEDLGEARKYIHGLGLPEDCIPFAACIGGKKPVCHWPLEKYEVLLNKIIAETNAVPVFIGGPFDRDNIQFLMQKLPAGRTFYASELASDLRKTIGLLSQMSFYLGNDTGTMHLAASAGLQCIVMMPSHNFKGLWNPLGEGHFILQCEPELECSCCREATCPLGTPAKCMNAIEPERVFKAVLSILR
jgi:ADP-heptose:LPS heptosyltransferase